MMKNFVVLLVTIIVVFKFKYFASGNDLDVSFPGDIRICQTPLGQEGDCKSFSECRSVDNKTEDYIRRSHCGFTTGKEPDVCCPLNYSIPYMHRKSSIRFISSHYLPSTNLCGKIPPTITHRIKGGTPADRGEFPWMALLQYKDYYETVEYNCGGFLINNRYVLTAAHCVNSSLENVILGINNYIITNEENKTVGIEKKIVFESYSYNYTNDKEYHYHDIALLRLNEKIDYTPWISPICLPNTIDEIFKSYVERDVEVAGWGATGPRSAGSHILMKVSVPIVACGWYYRNWYDHGQLCAATKTKDACHGDSGGPMMVLENKNGVIRWYAIGIVSAGGANCNTRQFQLGIYTKVAKYMYWIGKNLKP